MKNNLPTDFKLTSLGYEIDTNPDKFGFLNATPEAAHDLELTHQLFEEQGYVYIPGFFDRQQILEARHTLTSMLAKEDLLDPNFPHWEGVAREGQKLTMKADLANGNPKIQNIVYGEKILKFYEDFFQSNVTYFSYIWMRVMSKGFGTAPHCDIVYMGRGTQRLITNWIIYGDLTFDVGGLMVLEGSHKKSDKIRNY